MYAKVFKSIFRSSIWDQPSDIRITWITCLALCDDSGNFTSTRSALARTANVPISMVNDALDQLMAPDPSSTTPDDEGRRIEYCGNNTWHVINYQKYNAIAKAETVREQTRKRVAAFRQGKSEHDVTACNADVTQGDQKETPITIALPLTQPVTTPVPEQEKEAPPSVKPDPIKEAKKAINRSITFDPATFTLHGITEADRDQWRGYAPGVDVDTEIEAFLDYMQTHPEALDRTLKTGAWRAALNTRFRNVAKYGSKSGANSRVGTPQQERPHPFFDNKGVEFASAKMMRRMAEEEAIKAAQDAARLQAIEEARYDS